MHPSASKDRPRSLTTRLSAVAEDGGTHLQMALRQGVTSTAAFGTRLVVIENVAKIYVALQDGPPEDQAAHLATGMLLGHAVTALSIPLGHQLADWAGRHVAHGFGGAELAARPDAKWSADRLRELVFLGVFAINAGLTEGEEAPEYTMARSFAAGFIASGLWSLGSQCLDWVKSKPVDLSRPNLRDLAVKVLAGGPLYAGSGYLYGRLVADIAGKAATATRLAKACGSLVRLSGWLVPRPLLDAVYASSASPGSSASRGAEGPDPAATRQAVVTGAGAAASVGGVQDAAADALQGTTQGARAGGDSLSASPASRSDSRSNTAGSPSPSTARSSPSSVGSRKSITAPGALNTPSQSMSRSSSLAGEDAPPATPDEIPHLELRARSARRSTRHGGAEANGATAGLTSHARSARRLPNTTSSRFQTQPVRQLHQSPTPGEVPSLIKAGPANGKRVLTPDPPPRAPVSTPSVSRVPEMMALETTPSTGRKTGSRPYATS